MSYNPGGWNDGKLKTYFLLFLVAMLGVALAQWAGWIHIDPPTPVQAQ